MAAAAFPPDSVHRIAALDRFPELLHGISTRRTPEGGDWNLSARRGPTGDPPGWTSALANRRRLAAALGISPDSMTGCQQVHGSVVSMVGPEDRGRGMSPESPPIMGADGMITSAKGVYLFTLSADCAPVFLYDHVRGVVSLVHSGWKGTVNKIAGKAVALMGERFGSVPADIVAAVGPAIGPCCYEVGPDVIDAAEAAFVRPWEGENPLLAERGTSVHFDLAEGVRRALLEAGVRPDDITVDGLCTAHNLDMFYSHRAELGRCGLFGAVFGLRAGDA